MKMPRTLIPAIDYIYSLNDVMNNMGFSVAPRLFVEDSRFSHPVGAPSRVFLNYDHMMLKDFLSIANIASSNWQFLGADDAGVALFEFVAAGDDIESYFNFERRVNAEGFVEPYEFWTFPRGARLEQPFQFRAEFPLYATKGGGTAVLRSGTYEFVDAPQWTPGMDKEHKRGDRVPDNWTGQLCGTYRPLLVAEQEMAFDQGRVACLEGEDENPPFENCEADQHWLQGYQYGLREQREQSAMVAYG
jgi:hypothetical protein